MIFPGQCLWFLNVYRELISRDTFCYFYIFTPYLYAWYCVLVGAESREDITVAAVACWVYYIVVIILYYLFAMYNIIACSWAYVHTVE